MIAFCFLLYDKVQHGERWELFFTELDDLGVPFRIYTHPKKITRETQQWVADGKIPKTIPTGWGEYSLLEACLLMYKEALKDRKNQYFVLCSGADIPLHRPDYFMKQITKDRKSHLDIRYNDDIEAYAASQWMYLSRSGAKDLVRLLNPRDREARYFLDYWIPETDPNGEEDCTVCEAYGADEAIPVNWFIELYGSPGSANFKKHIKDSTVTYAYFRTPDTQSPKIWTARTLVPYRRWEMCKCLFGRKYDDSAVKKLGWCCDQEFTKGELTKFKAMKRKDGPEAHWGQPRW